MKGKHRNNFGVFFPLAHGWRRVKSLLPAGANSHANGGAGPPFDLLKYLQEQRGTQSKRRNTLIPKKAQNVQTVQTNYSSDQDLHPKETKPGLTRFLRNLLSQPQLVTSTSHTTSPLSQPVHGERRSLLPCCLKGLFLTAATQLPGLVRFLCITFVG